MNITIDDNFIAGIIGGTILTGMEMIIVLLAILLSWLLKSGATMADGFTTVLLITNIILMTILIKNRTIKLEMINPKEEQKMNRKVKK